MFYLVLLLILGFGVPPTEENRNVEPEFDCLFFAAKIESYKPDRERAGPV